MSVAGALRSGRRAVLLAQRERLAVLLDDADGQVAAGLSRELRLVEKELEGLNDSGSGTRKDALAARREAKQASDGGGRAAG